VFTKHEKSPIAEWDSPVFSIVERTLPLELSDAADAMDVELQAYLKEALAANAHADIVPDLEDIEDFEEDDVPF
jgi:hypothetical protein